MPENFNDVSDAFDGWLQTVIGTRNPGSFVCGRWVAGTPAALSFSGVVQNATPDDMLVLDEGERTKESIKIHTTFKLIPQIKGATNGDLISYDSNTWLVFNVGHKNIGGYHKAIAIKQ